MPPPSHQLLADVGVTDRNHSERSPIPVCAFALHCDRPAEHQISQGILRLRAETSEAAVAFGDVGGDGRGGAVELVSEEAVAAGEVFGSQADLVCEIDGLLVDDELFEREGHWGVTGAF